MSYKLLQSIIALLQLFHTSTINFIIAFSKSEEKFNNLITATCKFSKKVLLISEEFKYSADD